MMSLLNNLKKRSYSEELKIQLNIEEGNVGEALGWRTLVQHMAQSAG